MLGLLEQGDATMNDVYGRLVVALKRQAGMVVGDPEPLSLRRLRADQRRWLTYRDDVCARRGRGHEGAYWGVSRAQCLSGFAAERAHQLEGRIAALQSQ